MPHFEIVQHFPFDRDRVFAFFLRPANVVAVAPPEMGMQLLEAPEVAQVGSRIVVRIRLWGLSTRIITEVVEVVAPELLVEEQRQGPFARWRHERRLVALGANETAVTERVDYEPPGGLLGLTLMTRAIEVQLARAYESRQGRMLEMLAAGR
jgi:ligand-binding SRPBCC domain-containing protein